MDKSIQDRASESVTIMRKLVETLQLPEDDPDIIALRVEMNKYIRTGEPWSGTINFTRWGRIAHCVFPRKASKPVEVTLKSIT